MRLARFRRLRIHRRLRRFVPSEAGGALAELAVVLPVLILLAIGVMDYGRVFFTSVSVANAARAGAEFGSQTPANAGNQTRIQDFARLEGADVALVTVTSNRVCRCPGSAAVVACVGFTCGGGYGMPQEFVEVTATKAVPLLLRYVGIPTSITVSRTATFRVQ